MNRAEPEPSADEAPNPSPPIKTPGVALRKLKLLFLTSETGDAKTLEYDLGETQEQRDAELDVVEAELRDVWTEVTRLVEANDPLAFHHCTRKFCNCHKAREVFVPGSLYGQEGGT
jgi:hypothetical protein